MGVVLMQGDCLEKMKKLPDGCVDMILCDLPYGTTQCKWDVVIPFEPLWEQYKRVCRGTVVLTAAQPFSSLLVTSNIKDFRYQWVWVKSKITGVLNAKRMPVRKHEQILVFGALTTYNAQGIRPKGTTTKQGGCSDNYGVRGTKPYTQEFENWPRDVIEVASEGKTLHPTQKPVALMEYLIKTYTHPGMLVLDNCMGSGTTGVACINTGRNFVGIEKDPKYFEIARRRIAAAKEAAK